MLFMKVDGVEGDCEVQGYQKWIELGFLHLNAQIPYNPDETAYKSGTFQLSPITSSAKSVAHIPALVKKTADGSHIPNVEIHETVTDNGEKAVKIYKLTDNTFTGLDLSANADGMAGGGGFGIVYATLELEILTIPTKGATPVSKGTITYDAKQKKVMA